LSLASEVLIPSFTSLLPSANDSDCIDDTVDDESVSDDETVNDDESVSDDDVDDEADAVDTVDVEAVGVEAVGDEAVGDTDGVSFLPAFSSKRVFSSTIFSFIAFIASIPRRFRISTNSDASKGLSLMKEGYPKKYCM
jgi:hypothetical protein